MENRRSKLEAIYEQQGQYVWNCLRRLRVQERDLADLCQEVFLIAYRKLDEFDEDKPVQPWLFGIAYRVASNYRRKASRQREELGEVGPVPNAPEVVEQMSTERAREIVMKALDEVDMEKRAIFILFKLEDHEMADIAETLSIPRQTAYSRLRAAEEQFEKSAKAILAEESSR